MPPQRSDHDAASKGSPSPARREVPFSNTRPLSRGASRALVIFSILFVLAASFGGAYLLIQLAEADAQQQQQPAPPADSAAAPLPGPGP